MDVVDGVVDGRHDAVPRRAGLASNASGGVFDGVNDLVDGLAVAVAECVCAALGFVLPGVGFTLGRGALGDCGVVRLLRSRVGLGTGGAALAGDVGRGVGDVVAAVAAAAARGVVGGFGPAIGFGGASAAAPLGASSGIRHIVAVGGLPVAAGIILGVVIRVAGVAFLAVWIRRGSTGLAARLVVTFVAVGGRHRGGQPHKPDHQEENYEQSSHTQHKREEYTVLARHARIRRT